MKIEVDGEEVYDLFFEQYYDIHNPAEPKVVPTEAGLKLLKALRKHLFPPDQRWKPEEER